MATEKGHNLAEIAKNLGINSLICRWKKELVEAPAILSEVLNILEETGKKHFPVVLPLHPRTFNIIRNNINLCNRFSKRGNDFLIFTEPFSFLEMIAAEKKCKLIMTDSGGVQKEAFFHRKPCITLRTETEWVELIDVGGISLQASKGK
ncbi:MAG: UDP-N-acetylglucosamine 2-epimerase [Candidatus Riflebacteria bacterium]|nr:UDP-N-acetylglucosamine 2-epimerase [Candidatus Riflebacteria bacterium]